MNPQVVALRAWTKDRLSIAWETLATIVLETLRGFRADRGVDLAASLAFASLLTAIPLLATFSFFIAAIFDENDAQFLDFLGSILPYHTEFVTETVRSFVAESKAVSGIGFVVLIFASVRLIFAIEKQFNAVWGAPGRRAWLARVVLYSAVLLVLSVVIGGLGIRMRSLASERPLSASVAPFLIEVAALTVLYRYLPNAKVFWRNAGIAGLVISILLELLRALFGLYVQALSRMNLITGTMTLILLVLVSIYFVWALVLLGVELTHVLQKTTRRGRRNRGSAPGRAENAIRMLLRLAEGGRHDFHALYGEQEGSSVEAEGLLGQLEAKGLIEKDRARGFVLAQRPEEITVARVVEAISPSLYTIEPDERDRVAKVLAPLFEHLDAERRSVLGATLADLRRL